MATIYETNLVKKLQESCKVNLDSYLFDFDKKTVDYNNYFFKPRDQGKTDSFKFSIGEPKNPVQASTLKVNLDTSSRDNHVHGSTVFSEGFDHYYDGAAAEIVKDIEDTFLEEYDINCMPSKDSRMEEFMFESASDLRSWDDEKLNRFIDLFNSINEDNKLLEDENNELLDVQQELSNEVEQLRVQLAGCGSAALGYGGDCKKGDYGWSASFQDVQNLYEKYSKIDEYSAYLIDNCAITNVKDAMIHLKNYLETKENNNDLTVTQSGITDRDDVWDSIKWNLNADFKNITITKNEDKSFCVKTVSDPKSPYWDDVVGVSPMKAPSISISELRNQYSDNHNEDKLKAKINNDSDALVVLTKKIDKLALNCMYGSMAKKEIRTMEDWETALKFPDEYGITLRKVI
jgi:hypothetical protein